MHMVVKCMVLPVLRCTSNSPVCLVAMSAVCCPKLYNRVADFGAYPWIVRPMRNTPDPLIAYFSILGYPMGGMEREAWLVPPVADGDKVMLQARGLPGGTVPLVRPTKVSVETSVVGSDVPLPEACPSLLTVTMPGGTKYHAGGCAPTDLDGRIRYSVVAPGDPCLNSAPTDQWWGLRQGRPGALPYLTTGNPTVPRTPGTGRELRALPTDPLSNIFDLAWLPAGSMRGYPVTVTFVLPYVPAPGDCTIATLRRPPVGFPGAVAGPLFE